MNQAGRGISGGGELVRFPLRWIVLFTGYKATEDYVPAASEGEAAALVKEATDICVAFHPHSEIRLFPKEALLFWHAKTTGDWIVTRVSTAPNPEGIRTALEYSSVVLDEDSFRELGYNPFLTRHLQLHEKVRSQFLDHNSQRLWVDVPADSFSAFTASLDPGLSRSNPSAAASADEIIPGLGSDRISSAENVEKIEKYCAYTSMLKKVPPTFATWWPTGDAPAGYFDIVLHSPPTRTMSLRDASDTVAALGAEITAALPRMPGDDTVASELARSVLANIDSAQRAISDAISRLNSESVDQFREHLASASNSVAQVAANLNLIVKRLDDRISRTDANRLIRLAKQSEAIGPEFVGIRHPNPFAARSPASNGAVPSRGAVPAGASRKSNVLLIAGGVGLLAAIAAAAALLSHHSAPDMPAPPTTHGKASLTGTPGNSGTHVHPAAQGSSDGGAVTAPSDQMKIASQPLVDSQDSVQDAAKTEAQVEAKKAAAVDPTKSLNDNELDKITFASIKSAYRDKLSSEQFKKAFSNGDFGVSTYAELQQRVPQLTASVHEAAHVAASEGRDEHKILAATNTAAAAQAQALAEEQKRKEEEAKRASEASRNARSGASSGGSRVDEAQSKRTRQHGAEATPAPSTRHNPQKNGTAGDSAAKKASAKSNEPASNAGTASQTGL